MGNEFTIINGMIILPTVKPEGQTPLRNLLPDLQTPNNPLINAPLVFDGAFHSRRADDLRHNLLSIIFGGQENVPPQYLSPKIPNQELSPKLQNQETNGLVHQTLNTLITLVQEHPALESLPTSKSPAFWDQVRQMSEVRISEVFVNGKPEPRAVSRYSELLVRLNRLVAQTSQTNITPTNTAEHLEKFLATIPVAEREVFQARYLIDQIFGTNELYVGNGIALDERGDFPLRLFLNVNGANPDLTPHVVLSLLNGVTGAEETFTPFRMESIFPGGQVLFSAKSAALLSLSLALYQNVNSRLSLLDVALNTPLTPKPAPLVNEILTKRNVIQATDQKSFENLKIPGCSNEIIVIGGFINGALKGGTDQLRKFADQKIDSRNAKNSDLISYNFSAGATGALMGASIGCLAPLAEKSVGEIIGLTASLIVGLYDRQLQVIGAAAIVSVIRSGVQNILDIMSVNPINLEPSSQDKNLPAANLSDLVENDLRQKLFNSRIGLLAPT